MNRSFDRYDFVAVLALFAGVAAWAFLWAHPYPHPDLWPFLVAVSDKVGFAAFGIAGRLALGVFAALAYLVLRGFWFLHRDPADDLPDSFLYARMAPICGAAAFAMFPYSWRAGQFLSPGFALLVLDLFGIFFWLVGRGGRGLLAYLLAYFIIGFVSGYNPLGLAVLGFVGFSDAVLRWQDGQALSEGEDEDEAIAMRRKSVEKWLSILVVTVGFMLGAFLVVALTAENGGTHGFVALFAAWWTAWSGTAVRSVRCPELLALVLSVIVAAVALVVGRRIRSLGLYGLMTCRVLSGLLAIATLMMILRAVDRAERIRLQAIREYVNLVADDAAGAKFLFTDGRFDDMLRLEFASRGVGTVILNTLRAPSAEEAARLKTLAPEPGDRVIFEAGGAEVFKAWARERLDRLAQSAWQLGGSTVRRYGRAKQRTQGSVIRCEDEARKEAADAADSRFVAWSRRILAIAEGNPMGGSLFGGTDKAVAARFDSLLWRAARLAGERADRLSAKKAVVVAERERQMMWRLDELNESLREQGEVVERLLPTEKLVCTSREALDIALKRADFTLAKRYAREILVATPDDPRANFALGMANLEAKEYFAASVCLEKVLKKTPNEPASLNNLAIAYMKLGQGEKALACAEHAAKVYPKSSEIQQTLAEIRKNMKRVDP